jgi:hypothetical protein
MHDMVKECINFKLYIYLLTACPNDNDEDTRYLHFELATCFKIKKNNWMKSYKKLYYSQSSLDRQGS